MQSPTHTLLALALLSRKGASKRNWAIFIGSLIPDAFIYICWVWLTFVKGHSQGDIWNEIYFNASMQLTGAIFNSVPIYLGLVAIGIWQRQKLWGKLVLFGALASLIHIATDLPVHADDAHRHFWPISDWRFYSQLSYWDNNHHAVWVSAIEAILALGAIIILWRRFPKLWVKLILGVLAMLYILVQALVFLAPWDG